MIPFSLNYIVLLIALISVSCVQRLPDKVLCKYPYSAKKLPIEAKGNVISIIGTDTNLALKLGVGVDDGNFGPEDGFVGIRAATSSRYIITHKNGEIQEIAESMITTVNLDVIDHILDVQLTSDGVILITEDVSDGLPVARYILLLPKKVGYDVRYLYPGYSFEETELFETPNKISIQNNKKAIINGKCISIESIPYRIEPFSLGG